MQCNRKIALFFYYKKTEEKGVGERYGKNGIYKTPGAVI